MPPIFVPPKPVVSGDVRPRARVGGNEIFAPLGGSRLAVVLHEIANRFGPHHPELKRLAHSALTGQSTPGSRAEPTPRAGIFTKIRDYLLGIGRGHDPYTDMGMDAMNPQGEGGGKAIGRWAKGGRRVRKRIQANKAHGGPDYIESAVDRGRKPRGDVAGTPPENPRQPRPLNEEDIERAKHLATSYNWHRVGAGLLTDHLVNRFVEGMLKPNAARNTHLRHANNLFGVPALALDAQERGTRGKLFGVKRPAWAGEQPSVPTAMDRKYAKLRQADPEKWRRAYRQFWDGLRQHMKGNAGRYGLTASDITDEMLERSLRRLGENEENIHGDINNRAGIGSRLATSRNLSEGVGRAKVAEVAHREPAYTQTSKGQIRARPKAVPGQFRRKR